MKKEVTEAELQEFAHEFLKEVETSRGGATVVELRGNLGAGKTSFTQCIAREFGIKENITSPTFVILKKYEIANREKFNYLIHIDAYRLNDSKELSVLGWDRLLEDPKNIIFIEWPGIVGDILPKDVITVSFSVSSEKSRLIEVEY